MFSRSSIFNFDTLVEFPRPSRVFVVVIVALICIGFFISMKRSHIERIAPRSPMSPILSYLHNQYTGKAKVLFLGSSRFVSCIKTDLFAELSGIDSNSVLNLALDSGGFWEDLVICREAPWILESASLAVINIEPWMFNENLLHPIYKTPHEFEPHYYTWAGFNERMQIPKIQTRARLLFDLLWPLTERRKLTDWSDGIEAVISDTIPPGFLTVPLYHYDAATYTIRANDPFFKAYSIAKCHLNNYNFSEHKAANLVELIKRMQEKSIKVVLLQPPIRKEYMDVIYNNPDYLTIYRNVLAYIRGFEKDQVHVIIWETPEDCKLDDSIFIDYGHFTLGGAERFTGVLFSSLQQMEWLDVCDEKKQQSNQLLYPDL